MGKRSRKHHRRQHLSKEKREYLVRAGYCNRHHIKAKSKGGHANPQNMILLDERRHAAYHLLFGLKTFDQAAELLIRTAEIKRLQTLEVYDGDD